MAIARPAQPQIDLITEYFNTNGIDLTPDNGKNLPLDIEAAPNEKWSINVIVLTYDGPRWAHYRHELREFVVSGILASDLDLRQKDVNLLCNKFLTNKDKFDIFYEPLVHPEVN